MNRDLRLYLAVIGLPAFVFAVGGIMLLRLEYARAGDRAAEARHERGESHARTLQQAIRGAVDEAGREAAMAGMLDDEAHVRGAFFWSKGAGVTWQTNLPAHVAAALDGNMKWRANGKKGTSAPRGWLLPLESEPDVAVAWARAGKNEVAGFVVDMREGLFGGDPKVLSGAGMCVVALLFCALAAGGWQLVRAARRAREESERKTTFIDNLSHELKMPLAVVRMKVERLLAGKVDGDEKLQAAYRTIADENGEVIRQIDALLELVRTGKGTRRYTRTTFDLAAAVRDSATAMAGRFPPDCLTVSGCEEPVFVHADADAVRQIVRNLLDNAAKYAADKGPVEVGTGRADGRVVVTVADRGDGIPPGQRESIFERFYRIDNDLTRTTGGTGIGLSLARCFARDMGGDVTVAARPGGGSIFTLELPEERNG